jgi:hypothetical protein
MKIKELSEQDSKPDYAEAIAVIEKSAAAAKRPVSAEDCRLDIDEAVEAYIFHRGLKGEGSVKGAPRAERLRKSADNVKWLISECDLLLKGDRYIDPLVWALEPNNYRQNPEKASRHIAALQDVLKPYAAWLQKASEIAEDAIPGPGNRSGSLERDFVGYLILLFKDHTGEELSKNATKDAYVVGDERYKGSIVNFVRAVAESNPTLSGLPVKWGGMVDECLKYLHKYPDTEDDIMFRSGRRTRLMPKYRLLGKRK